MSSLLSLSLNSLFVLLIVHTLCVYIFVCTCPRVCTRVYTHVKDLAARELTYPSLSYSRKILRESNSKACGLQAPFSKPLILLKYHTYTVHVCNYYRCYSVGFTYMYMYLLHATLTLCDYFCSFMLYSPCNTCTLHKALFYMYDSFAIICGIL